ncbi:helix-turn-helix transcriptional regulator [Candidatus Saganbacteria bacterium]|nr:helix-turn-helix transcriptional regulator [Candidatus Saganbacteria bacterium]
MNIGENIKRYRLKAGLSREKLVLKCRGEFSSSHLLSVEKGRTKNPGVEMVSCIAEALGVSVDTLLGKKFKPKD